MNRRRFLQQAAAFSGLVATEFLPWQTLSAIAGEVDDFIRGPAVPDQPLRQISKHVWIVHAKHGFPTPENQGLMSNLTFIDTAKGVVVVDSGASVQIGEMAIRQIKRQFRKPVVAVINTHFHGDHWLGNDAFAAEYKGLPLYAHPGAIETIRGIQGNLWLTLLEKGTNGATLGTRIVPPDHPLNHGAELAFGDVTLRIHHYGKAHTDHDLCVEVLEDRLTCVGDVAMDHRIANMDDGSYNGTFKTYAALEQTGSKIWLPAHGKPGPDVLKWNRSLFEGIYQPCVQAIKEGKPLDEAKTLVLRDPRVATQARTTLGFETYIGKYVSIAYLEAEADAF